MLKKQVGMLSLLIAVMCLMTLPFLVSCAPQIEPEKPKPVETRVFTVGFQGDASGAVACCEYSALLGLKSYLAYCNDEKLVSGIDFKVINYDNRYDISKVPVGYRWLVDNGANLLVGITGTTNEGVKPLVDAEKRVYIGYNATRLSTNPPGWAFMTSPLNENVSVTMADWFIKNWDYDVKGRPPRIQAIGWDNALGRGGTDALESYCQELQARGKVKWNGKIVLPTRTMDLAAAALELNQKGTDLVHSTLPSAAMCMLLKEKVAKGYDFQVSTGDWGTICWQASIGIAGEALGGLYWLSNMNWFTDDTPAMKLLNENLTKYTSATDIEKFGLKIEDSFVCGYVEAMVIKQAANAILAAGDDLFDQQAWYDQLSSMSPDTEGIWRDITWTSTKRAGANQVRLYKIQPDGMPKLVNDWMPVNVKF